MANNGNESVEKPRVEFFLFSSLVVSINRQLYCSCAELSSFSCKAAKTARSLSAQNSKGSFRLTPPQSLTFTMQVGNSPPLFEKTCFPWDQTTGRVSSLIPTAIEAKLTVFFLRLRGRPAILTGKIDRLNWPQWPINLFFRCKTPNSFTLFVFDKTECCKNLVRCRLGIYLSISADFARFLYDQVYHKSGYS